VAGNNAAGADNAGGAAGGLADNNAGAGNGNQANGQGQAVIADIADGRVATSATPEGLDETAEDTEYTIVDPQVATAAGIETTESANRWWVLVLLTLAIAIAFASYKFYTVYKNGEKK
jgi:hypothetical protein